MDPCVSLSVDVLAKLIDNGKTPVVGKRAARKYASGLNGNQVEGLNRINVDAGQVYHDQFLRKGISDGCVDY